MISVPNHRLRLNGNSALIAFCLILLITACSAGKRVQTDYVVTSPSENITRPPVTMQQQMEDPVVQPSPEVHQDDTPEHVVLLEEEKPVIEVEPYIAEEPAPVYSEDPTYLPPREIPIMELPVEETPVVREEPVMPDFIPERMPVNDLGAGSVALPPPPEPILPEGQQDFYGQLYNVAILLPFKSFDPVNTSANDTMLQKTKEIIEFYEGMVIALEQLRGIGMNMNVYVFDTENSELKTQALVSQLYAYPLDLIIGPVYNKNLKLVAEYAKNTGTYMISPLSPSTSITEGNPFFVMANPSIETHCRRIFDFILLNYSTENLMTIGRSTPKEAALADAIENYAMGTGVANINKVTVAGEVELEAYLRPFVNNVVVVPSFNEIFVTETIRRLNILSQKYDITLFGMPNWLEMQSVDIDALQNLNFHLTNEFWVTKESDDHNGFSQLYSDRFHGKPTEQAQKGFDLLIYLGRMIGSNGSSLSYGFTNPPHDGIYNNYSFQQSYAPGSFTGFDFFENKYVHILRLEDYNLFKVN